MSYCLSETVTQQCYGRLGALFSRISGELPVFLIPPTLQKASPRSSVMRWRSYFEFPITFLHPYALSIIKHFIKTDEDLHGDLLQLFCFLALTHWVKWTTKRAYPTWLLTSVFFLLGCLGHCATSRKVAGSIPDGVIGIFHWHNPSGRTMVLGLSRPLTEMSTRNISWGVKVAVAIGWQSYHLHVPIVLKSGSINLLETSGPFQACAGSASFC